MEPSYLRFALYAAAAAMVIALLMKLRRRLELSAAKYRSIEGHARMSRRLARLMPFYEYSQNQFFRTDNAPPEVEARRRQAFDSLAGCIGNGFQKPFKPRETPRGISDLQFISRYRVPFQFSRMVRDRLTSGSFLQSSDGVMVTDLDGNRFYDLAGSYGVNVFGYDFYKECIVQGNERVRDLGPVLGAYHPIVADNVRRLKLISGLDEVSFHMSGTEAVMQAVRLARYHTRRSHLVRLCGAYHGWWGDVQPGNWQSDPANATYTLSDMSEKTLRVLKTRTDIACVLVNPLQALHPNAGAPGDSSLVDGSRRAHFDRAAYAAWLKQLRDVCSARGIVLVFDEVFVGFRIARGGAQEFFGVKADMVTYGKTLGGGLPVGVVCGRADLMKRFREDRPADICFARGTFNSNPYVMGAMDQFLTRLDQPDIAGLYDGLDERWNERAATLNERLGAANLPVRVANLSSIWTVLYTKPSRYNWMLQYYLRAHGLALSWTGSGRLIFSLNYHDEEFEAVADRFVVAASEMERDGWFWTEPAATNKAVKRTLFKEMFAHRF